MLCVHNEDIEMFELILCVSVVPLWKWLYTHNVDIETFDCHEWILCVSEGFSSELLCVHNVGIETFDLHGLILCVSEGLSLLLGSHILNIYVFWAPYWNVWDWQLTSLLVWSVNVKYPNEMKRCVNNVTISNMNMKVWLKSELQKHQYTIHNTDHRLASDC